MLASSTVVFRRRSSNTAVPNLFGTRDQLRGRQFFHWGGGRWFQNDSSALLSSSSLAVKPGSTRWDRYRSTAGGWEPLL